MTTFKERISKLQENKSFKAEIREESVTDFTEMLENFRLFVSITFIAANLLFIGYILVRSSRGGSI